MHRFNFGQALVTAIDVLHEAGLLTLQVIEPKWAWVKHRYPKWVARSVNGCGSKLNRRGKPRVLVFGSIYQGSILVPVF